jgi:CBS domain-containing protein
MENVIVVPSQVRSAASVIERAAANNDAYLESSDSAFCGLTDFRREYLITVEADSSIDAALDDMNRLGVHALLVTRQEVESMEQQVVGLITYYDIERSRPHRLSPAAVAGKPRAICVSDVMTPWNELPLVRYESLQSLTASEVYEMFQGTGLTHLLVIETDHNGLALARGLLSRATLAKRLSRPRVAFTR